MPAVTGGWVRPQRRTELPSGVIQMGVQKLCARPRTVHLTDPVQGGSANAYDYATQDPVNLFDLTGECVPGKGKCYGPPTPPRLIRQYREKTRRLSREAHVRSPVVRTRTCTAIACRVGWPHGGHSGGVGRFIENTVNKVVHHLLDAGEAATLRWAKNLHNEAIWVCARDATAAWGETAEMRAASAAEGAPGRGAATFASVLYSAASCL